MKRIRVAIAFAAGLSAVIAVGKLGPSSLPASGKTTTLGKTSEPRAPGLASEQLEGVGPSGRDVAADMPVAPAPSTDLVRRLVPQWSELSSGEALAMNSVAVHLAAALQRFENAADADTYLSNLLFREKLLLSLEKISNHDYEVIDIRSMEQSETEDLSYSAFPAGDTHLLIEFRREKDAAVFSVIDAIAEREQAAWNASADKFNELALADRQRRVEQASEVREQLTEVSKELTELVKQGQMGSNLWQTLIARQRNLMTSEHRLPDGFVVDLKDYRAWVRKSIGR